MNANKRKYFLCISEALRAFGDHSGIGDGFFPNHVTRGFRITESQTFAFICGLKIVFAPFTICKVTQKTAPLFAEGAVCVCIDCRYQAGSACFWL